MMFDLIRKAMLTGVGLASISIDKIDEIAKEMMEQGNLTEQEGRKLVQEMMGYAEKSKEQLEKQVAFYVEKALDKMDVARKKEVEELRETLLQLQEKIEKTEAE